MGKRRTVRTAANRPKVKSEAIVAKAYPLLSETIEGGIKWGLRRVFKYRDKDTITEAELLDETIVDTILNCVMVEVCERFDFPEPEGE